MERNETYLYGSYYEFYILRAFGSMRSEHGAENIYYKALLDSELRGIEHDRRLTSLEEVKQYLENATLQFLEKPVDKIEKEALLKILEVFKHSDSALEMANFIKLGLDSTKRFI
jgi:hypothetical protein